MIGNRFNSITGDFLLTEPHFRGLIFFRLGLLVLIFHASGTDGKEVFFITTAFNKLSLHLKSEIPLKVFSFYQLILAVKQLFDTEGAWVVNE